MILFDKDIIPGKTYPIIVAEISCNHEGKIEQAEKLINAAKAAGADAVKIQVYTAGDMTNDISYKIKGSIWDGEKLYKLYKKTESNYTLAHDMIMHARDVKIPIFASVFSKESFEFAAKYNLPAFKIASFEFTDYELIKHVAWLGRPMLLSAGMSDFTDRTRALRCCDPTNTVLMHCVSAYPTRLEDASLGNITLYRHQHVVNVGYSDHTRGITAGPLAAALGACVIEKHLALPDTSPEDETFSLHPNEFKDYVLRCKVATNATYIHEPNIVEEPSIQFKRSLYAVEDIEPGEGFTKDNVRAMRPNRGLHPYQLETVLTKRAKEHIYAGTPLTWELMA